VEYFDVRSNSSSGRIIRLSENEYGIAQNIDPFIEFVSIGRPKLS
jgi:hypothetical protein